MLTKQERVVRNAVLAVVAAWGAAVVVASFTGLLAMLPTAVFGAGIILGIVAPTVTYFRSAGLQALAAKVGVRRLTAFQGWRIAAGIWFLWYASQGWLPAGFALKAGWGDIVAGAAGLLALWFWARPAGYVTANIIGLADFAVAVGTGMAMSLADRAGMHANGEFPGALIPLFGVGLTATTQFVALHLVWKDEKVGRGKLAEIAR